MSGYPELPPYIYGSEAGKLEKVWPLKRVLEAIDADRAMRAETEAKRLPQPTEHRPAALWLYRAPFHYQAGYVFDADCQMVSDDDRATDHIAQRVRGWGRIGYLVNGAAIQDEMGCIVAQALTEFWERNQPPKA